MAYTILVINPGSTSTKIAVYEGENQLFQKNITHPESELDKFEDILAQQDYRADVIRAAIQEWKVELSEFSAIIGRGGLLPNLLAGGYLVDENMVSALKAGIASPHASNLGALLAYSIAQPLGIPAYIYDGVTADEYKDIAKITGFPNIKREARTHVLNQKAVSRAVAKEKGTRYEDINVLVAHLGGGISIGIHEKGKIIDSIGDDSGPFSPERSGSVPLLYLIDLAFSGDYDKKSMMKMVRGAGGLKAYLGTADCREIEEMIANGDENAKKLYEAQAYQIAKGIGELAPVVDGKVDYVILTGGIAYSDQLTEMIAKRVAFIAPVVVYPGENEMEALAFGAIRLLDGESYHVYERKDK